MGCCLYKKKQKEEEIFIYSKAPPAIINEEIGVFVNDYQGREKFLFTPITEKTDLF